uniref:Uncharacterized protein n=1 Tax=Globodera rostochiensis TaxID=31243 RepID=A0A914HPX5_GLORO
MSSSSVFRSVNRLWRTDAHLQTRRPPRGRRLLEGFECLSECALRLYCSNASTCIERAYIQHCPASLLLCPFTRNRHFVSTRAKTMLKRIARGYSTQQKTTPSSSVVLTLEQYFRLLRSKRLSLAVALRRRELEQLLENNNNIDGKHFKMHGDGVVEEEEDSSEEEAKITASQYRAMRQPFLGCRLCALDPGSQHLHQLGNTHQSSVDYALKFLPTLNRQNALFISHEMSLNVAGVNLNEQFFRPNFPIFACDEFVRRDQFSEHCAAHLAYEDDGLAFFARCPNAQYGCTFHSDHQLLTVDGGLIRLWRTDAHLQTRRPPRGRRLLEGMLFSNLLELIKFWGFECLSECALRLYCSNASTCIERAYIQHCPASLLLCPFTRNRHFVSTRAKTMLKRIARGYSTQQKTTPSSSVVLTLEQYFRLLRSKRLSLAVALRRRELEQLLENNNNIDGKHFKMHGDGVVEEEEDSSEEEAKITASQYRAMRQPFLGCRLCALDPGSQHLHQLGSLRPAIRNDVQQQQEQHQTEKGNFIKQQTHINHLLITPSSFCQH